LTTIFFDRDERGWLSASVCCFVSQFRLLFFCCQFLLNPDQSWIGIFFIVILGGMGGSKFGEFGIIFFAQLVAYVLQLALRWAQPHQPVRSLYTRLFLSLHSYTSKCLEFELLDCWCCFFFDIKNEFEHDFCCFFQFKDVVMKRKRWLWIDNNLSASKTWLVVDGLTPGPYKLDCNHSRLSLRLGPAGILWQAYQEASSMLWGSDGLQ
jgi:hypothetical protein